MNETMGLIFITIGVAFNTFGCIGLLRLPDVYNRLQAATKGVTLGIGSIMFGIFLINGFSSLGIKALLAIPFIFLTSPTAAHALARGAHIFGVELWPKSLCDKYKEDRLHNAGGKNEKVI